MSADRYQHITDTELLERFYRSKDNQWLGVLLQRYTMLLLGVCMKYLKNEDDAKDAVQQVFLKSIAELHKYKVEYFKSWLYMVAKNHCLMKLRDKPGKAMTAFEEPVTTIEEENQTRQSWQDKDKMLDLMDAAIEVLNPGQKQCVTLFYLNKKSYSEIAETTGFSMMQVKSYIQNGKRNLKLELERMMKEQ